MSLFIMKILRVFRQKKENKIYESRVFVSIFLTSLDPPREFGNLVNTQFNASPDKSLHGHQVTTKIECVLLYIKQIYFTSHGNISPPFLPTYKYTHAHTHTHTHTHTYIYIYIL